MASISPKILLDIMRDYFEQAILKIEAVAPSGENGIHWSILKS